MDDHINRNNINVKPSNPGIQPQQRVDQYWSGVKNAIKSQDNRRGDGLNIPSVPPAGNPMPDAQRIWSSRTFSY